MTGPNEPAPRDGESRTLGSVAEGEEPESNILQVAELAMSHRGWTMTAHPASRVRSCHWSGLRAQPDFLPLRCQAPMSNTPTDRPVNGSSPALARPPRPNFLPRGKKISHRQATRAQEPGWPDAAHAEGRPALPSS
jgi:hypothetical protein